MHNPVAEYAFKYLSACWKKCDDAHNEMASILRPFALSRSAAASCLKASNGWQQQRQMRLAPAAFRVHAAAEASQPYPQTVNLDKGKAKTAQLQSETSKANDGHVDPKDPASKARVRLTISVMLCVCMHMYLQTHSAVWWPCYFVSASLKSMVIC